MFGAGSLALSEPKSLPIEAFSISSLE